MASQLALLFAQRLEVPVVLTDLDQTRLDKGVGYVHGEIDKLRSRGGSRPDRANRLKALVTGSLTKDAFADADFVIEAVFEEMSVKQTGVRRGRGRRVRQCILRDEHLLAVDHRDGRRTSRTPSGSSGSTSSTRSRCCRCWRSCGPSAPTTPRWRPPSPSRKALKKSAVLVKDAPAFVVNRLLTRFLGEVTRAVDEGTDFDRRRPRARPARPADVAVRAAGARRPGRRAARRGDAARALPRPLLRLRQPAPAGRGRQARRLHLGSRRASRSTPRSRAVRAAAERGPRRPATRCASARSPRSPRRSG